MVGGDVEALQVRKELRLRVAFAVHLYDKQLAGGDLPGQGGLHGGGDVAAAVIGMQYRYVLFGQCLAGKQQQKQHTQ